jgi:hypothetical protein
MRMTSECHHIKTRLTRFDMASINPDLILRPIVPMFYTIMRANSRSCEAARHLALGTWPSARCAVQLRELGARDSWQPGRWHLFRCTVQFPDPGTRGAGQPLCWHVDVVDILIFLISYKRSLVKKTVSFFIVT